jgi:hypothetical protein
MNPYVFGISALGFVFLYLGKDTFGPRLRRQLPIILPFELILVILTTALSSAANFRSNLNVTVLNKVPTGFVFTY